MSAWSYWPLISDLPSEIFRIRTVDAAPAWRQPDGCYDHTEIQKETKISENIVDIKKAKQRQEISLWVLRNVHAKARFFIGVLGVYNNVFFTVQNYVLNMYHKFKLLKNLARTIFTSSKHANFPSKMSALSHDKDDTEWFARM